MPLEIIQIKSFEEEKKKRDPDEFYKLFLKLFNEFNIVHLENEITDPKDYLIWRLCNKVKEEYEKNLSLLEKIEKLDKNIQDLQIIEMSKKISEKISEKTILEKNLNSTKVNLSFFIYFIIIYLLYCLGFKQSIKHEKFDS